MQVLSNPKVLLREMRAERLVLDREGCLHPWEAKLLERAEQLYRNGEIRQGNWLQVWSGKRTVFLVHRLPENKDEQEIVDKEIKLGLEGNHGIPVNPRLITFIGEV